MSLYELIRVVFDGPFATLWPMLVAPPLAALVCDRTARALDTSGEDRRLPAALALMPGLILLSLTFVPIRDVTTGAYPVSVRGWLLWWAPLLLAGLCMTWAIGRAILRQWKVARVFRIARPAGPDLAVVAAALGVRARVLDHEEIDCFVAGLVRPTVFVSQGALDAFDALELRAALAHEAAHIKGADGPLIFLLGLFCDLIPLPWRGPMAAFREACENRADRLAAESAGAVHLASALVAAANGARRLRPAHAFGHGGQEVLRLRLQRLLHGPASASDGRKGRVTLACGLFALFTLAGLPIAQAQMICTDHIEGRMARFQCPYHSTSLAAHVTPVKLKAPSTTSA
jgi:Zn-dependent protease with chaperone function